MKLHYAFVAIVFVLAKCEMIYDSDCGISEDVSSMLALTSSLALKGQEDPLDSDPRKVHEAEKANDARGNPAEAQSSVVLLALIGFTMAIFYMVNSHMQVVAKSTWSLVVASVSIFSAVLTNKTMDTIFVRALGVEEGIACAAIQLIVWWIAVIGILFLQKGNLLRLKGYGTIGGHILGFALVNLIVQIVTLHVFKNSIWKMFMLFFLYTKVVATLLLVTYAMHRCLKSTDPDTTQEDTRWVEQCTDTGIDFFCIGAAYVICLWIRWAIESPGGQVPDTGEVSIGHMGHRMATLLVVGIMLLVLAGILAKWHHSISQRDFAWVGDIVTTTTSLTAAMSLLWCANWILYDSLKTSLMEHIVVALIFSVVAFIGILVLSIAIHHGGAEKRLLRGIFTGLSLLVGMSWEKVFDTSLDGLEGFGGNEEAKRTRTLLASGALLALVLPAWMVYMLPRDDAELEAEVAMVRKKGGIPCWAMCCDWTWNPFEDEK